MCIRVHSCTHKSRAVKDWCMYLLGYVHLSFSVRTVYFFSCSSRQSVLCALVCVSVSTDAHSVLFLLSACLRVFMKRVLRARALLFSRVCSICRLHSACLFACFLHRAQESHAPCFAVALSFRFFWFVLCVHTQVCALHPFFLFVFFAVVAL
jgi:hypothetical protein